MTHHIDDSPFALHNRIEIVFVLDELAKHRVAINLDTAEDVGLVTSVLGVSSDGNHVYMDIGSDDKVNEKIVASKHVSFVTQTGVKVRWHSTHLRLVEMQDGGYAFSMLVPAVIERVQRREYFRLSTPQGSNALICKIPTATGVMEATIVDISVGGIGISIRGALPEIFSQGALLEGCSITLPVIGAVPTNLRVRGIWTSIKTKSGEQMSRIGLEFEGLSRGAANVIQRLIIQLEAEKISLN
jgi:c-di-GMP-binding flagellar brake protein YcgR